MLAHDFLGGQNFLRLEPGQKIRLVYGDGAVKTYWVTQRHSYQAMNPRSVYSGFTDLDTMATMNAAELFRKVYTGPDHVTFQTCLDKDGDPSWGRLFVIAERGPAADGGAATRPGPGRTGPAHCGPPLEYAATGQPQP